MSPKATDGWSISIWKKFFDRVHHDRLIARLEQRVKDRRLIDLIRRMLKAKVVLKEGRIVVDKR